MSSIRRLCTIFRPHLHKCNPFQRQRYRQYSTKEKSVIAQPTPPPFNHKKWALVFSFAAVSTLNEDDKKRKQEVSCCSGHKDDRKENTTQKTIDIDHEEVKENADPAFTSFEHEVEDFGELKWEKLYNDHRCTVHRRWLPNLDTYEYRCCGTYDDISAQDFVDAQMDDHYRKKWDPHVIELEVIESVDETIDIVRWLHRFPRPLNPRVYIYKREKRWSKSGIYTIESKVLTEEEHPTSEADKYSVRVETYSSTLRVRPHKEYENEGFDYVLIYYDHPKAVIPGPAYNWMVSKGGPYFLNYVHDAAKQLREERSSV